MTKHPSPWKWKDGILWDSNGQRVLTHMAGHPKENENYDLIAAAPELYEACKLAYANREHSYGYVRNKLKDALAKAGRETP